MRSRTFGYITIHGGKRDVYVSFAEGYNSVYLPKEDIPAVIKYLQAVHDEHKKRERSEECL